MCKQFEGVGVTRDELRAGVQVMVPVGATASVVNGTPCIIAWATVVGAVSERDASVMVDPSDMWWLDVHVASGVSGLPQMYRADEILGVPAPSLSLT